MNGISEQQKYYFVNRLSEYLYYGLFTVIVIPLSYWAARIFPYYYYFFLICAFTVVLLTPFIIYYLSKLSWYSWLAVYSTMFLLALLITLIYIKEKYIWGILQTELGLFYLYFLILRSSLTKWVKSYDFAEQRRLDRLNKKIENDLFNKYHV